MRVIAPFVGLGVAMLTHSFHNTFAGMIGGLGGLAAGTFLDWSGWFIMFIFTIWMIAREGRLLPKHLREEVNAGRMTAAQLRKASSPFGSLFSFLSGRATARFYQVCGELAHKKEQHATHGDEGGNLAIIAALQAELAQLSPQVRV